jgi:hypothetical protein
VQIIEQKVVFCVIRKVKVVQLPDNNYKYLYMLDVPKQV